MENIKYIRIQKSQSEEENKKITQSIHDYFTEAEFTSEDMCLLATEEIEEVNEEVIFSFLPEEKCNHLIQKLKDLNILEEVRDVTENILLSKEKTIAFESVFSTPDNRRILEDFLLKYLSVDHVLDKINEQGQESLNEIDRKILGRA